MCIQKTLSGIRFEAKIKTGSNSFSLKRLDDGFLIEVSSPPVEGKANREIIKELKKMLKADSVEIVKGLKSKNKTIVIRGNGSELLEKTKKL